LGLLFLVIISKNSKLVKILVLVIISLAIFEKQQNKQFNFKLIILYFMIFLFNFVNTD